MQFDFSQNYFDLFDLPINMQIDVNAITDRYRALQKELHPDRYADQDESVQRLAVQATSFVNTAFETLKSPLKLATYVLSLQGIDINSETDTRMNGAFLIKQMEWREALDDIADKETPFDALDELNDEVSAERKDNLTRLNDLIKQQSWDEARNGVRELQFIEKMRSEISLKEEVLEEL